MGRLLLHRFPISHFSEKGRALLEFKELDYDLKDYTLGLPQRKVVKLSGQRQVPVIELDGEIVSDSTRIAHWLDERFPDQPRLIPKEEPLRGEVLALEDEIDRVLGIGAPLLWFEDAVRNGRKNQVDLLAIEVHGLNVLGARTLAKTIAFARGLGLGNSFVRRKSERARAMLERFSRRLEKAPFLVGDSPTLADVAAVGITLHLEWPRSARMPNEVPVGQGVPGIVDDPALRRFFEWRREFYQRYLG